MGTSAALSITASPQEEIGEIITHVAFYGGWPTAANAVQIAKQVFDEKKQVMRWR